MQDEVNSKVVALSIRLGTATAKMTAHVLRQAMQKYLAEKQKPKTKMVDHTKHGKQTVGQLLEKNTELTNIEITDQNIKSFERVAKKYNIDFALKKDKAADPPRYVVFFKARDANVMDVAFKEFMNQSLVKFKKPSIRQKLTRNQAVVQNHEKERVKEKSKDRGQQL